MVTREAQFFGKAVRVPARRRHSRSRWRRSIPDDRYRAAFEASPDGILIVDAAGVIRDANPAALHLFRYESADLLGSRVERLVPRTVRDRHVEHRRAYGERPASRPMGIGMQLDGARSDGTLVPVEISLSPLAEADAPDVVVTIRDLTPRLRLRRFGAESLRAMEDERQRIALDLHDDTAQRLGALLLMLRVLQEVEERERDEILGAIRDQLLETAESVRRIARGLRPPALADVGLSAAIRGHLADVGLAELPRLELDLQRVDALLSADQRLVVYRVVQEALTNVMRHAEAELVRVSLKRDGDRVVLTVLDDGIGFDPRTRDATGLGLLGMDERAQMVGGRLRVDSRPGSGSTVALTIPLATEGDAR